MSKLNIEMKPAPELDLKCFMNLMVVLIPLLLVSAEFAKVAVIDIKLPEARGSQTRSAVTEQPQEDKSAKILLTAIITDSVVTLGAKGGFMPSLFYREFHRYVTKDGLDTLVEYEPGKQPRHPSGRELTVYERYDIFLYTSDDKRSIINCMYTKFGEMLTNVDGNPVEKVVAGDTVFALTNPRRRIIVSNPAEFESKPLSAYDELKNRLMKIKERYRDAEDADDLIIAAENEVIFDKIVQIMDAARSAEFPNISIAKLRG
ncbi:MAG: biopolymer transporter ExbD [Chitinispirillales bacterium]|jgi:biopolymer transport protein ExbD|nr:biopolymer transporter ExbD [Chitinispirillales bacterium]